MRNGWPALSRLRRWAWRVCCMLEVGSKDEAADDAEGDGEDDVFFHSVLSLLGLEPR